jgi:O-antigen/teichoic acid export membrane protein
LASDRDAALPSMRGGSPSAGGIDGRERDRSALARLGRGTGITWLTWMLARALALATLILLTRAIPSRDLGALFASMAAGLLGATLATGGLPDATTRNAVTNADAGFGRGDIHRALLRFIAICPVLLILLYVIAAGQSGGVDWSLLAASALLAVTQGGTSIIASVFRARGQAGRYALVTNLLASVGRTAVALAALTLGLGASVVLWTFGLINVAIIAWSWRSAFAGLQASRTSGEGEAALHLGGAAWSLMANLDVVVVGVVVGPASAGTYGVALRLTDFSFQFLVAMLVLYVPEATKLAVTDRPEQLETLYRTSSRWTALITLLIAGAGFVAAPSLSALILPHAASTATVVQRILLFGYAVHGALGIAYPTAVAVAAYRQIRTWAAWTIPLLLLSTVGFAQLWGLVGAACATTSAYVVVTVWWVVKLRAITGATPFDRRYGRAMCACLVSWLSAALVAHVAGNDAPAVSLVLIGLTAVITWTACVFFGGVLNPSERRAVSRMRTRPGRAPAL